MIQLKPKRRVLKEEQETTINIDPNTKIAYVYTCIPNEMKKLVKLQEHEEAKLVLDDPYGMAIEVPAKWIKVSPPRKINLTPEQLEQRRQRMADIRQKQKENQHA